MQDLKPLREGLKPSRRGFGFVRKSLIFKLP